MPGRRNAGTPCIVGSRIANSVCKSTASSCAHAAAGTLDGAVAECSESAGLNHPRCLLPPTPIPPCLSRSCLMLRACSQLAHGVPGTHIRLSASGGPPLSPPCSQGHSCPYPSSRTPSSTLAKHSNPRRCASPRRSAVSGSGPHCGTGKSPRWPNFSEQFRTRGMGTTLLLHCKKHCSPCCWVSPAASTRERLVDSLRRAPAAPARVANTAGAEAANPTTGVHPRDEG